VIHRAVRLTTETATKGLGVGSVYSITHAEERGGSGGMGEEV
jgi:hypothetical protein